MKNLILAFTLLLTPFFLQATTIFSDGSVPTESPSSTEMYDYDCTTPTGHVVISQSEDDYLVAGNACFETFDAESYASSQKAIRCSGVNSTFAVLEHTVIGSTHTQKILIDCKGAGSSGYVNAVTSVVFLQHVELKTCPPVDFPTHVYGYDSDNDNEPDFCADPNTLPLYDTCDGSEANNIVVDHVGPVCVSKPDGSICAFQPDTDLDGNPYYKISEANCYVDNDYPGDGDFTYKEDTPIDEPPVDEPPVDEPPVDEPPVDEPPVDEPPVDEPPVDEPPTGEEGGGGEGEGEGEEGGGGEGEGEGFCETPGNCSSSIAIRTTPTEGMEGFWVSEYPDGFDGMFLGKIEEYKQTELYRFLNNFQPSIGGGAPPDFDWCINFGRYMNFGCYSIAIDPRIFPALKIFLLITAAFACRIIIFGG